MTGLGGTEATVLRIARGLAPELPVSVEQKARRAEASSQGVRFRPMDLGRTDPPGAVIVVINAWKVALRLRRSNPEARIYLWLHVFPGRHNRAMGARLAEAGIPILCVSRSHARILSAFLGAPDGLLHIPNPIDDALRPDATPRDPALLFYASSPHKGLDEVLDAFASLRRRLPALRLALADPGYMRWPLPVLPAGVIRLGAQDHAAVIARMRRSLCLFYPQTRFAETFGLVIAEANAVGCPALLHRGLGANDEVAASPGQTLDASDPEEIAARILSWRASPPAVSLAPHFRLSSVLGRWRALIGADIRSNFTTGARPWSATSLCSSRPPTPRPETTPATAT